MRYIYIITNEANGKKYVGMSKSPESRFYSHIVGLRNGTHTNKCMQEDFDKYGEERFSMEIVEQGENIRMSYHEKRWIVFLHTYMKEYGYNSNDPSVQNLENGVSVLIDCKTLKQEIRKSEYSYEMIAEKLGIDKYRLYGMLNSNKVRIGYFYKICYTLGMNDEEAERMIKI